MEPTGAALGEAWERFLADSDSKVDAKLESLLPILIDAGYVEADTRTGRFTDNGIARGEALAKDSGE